MKICDEIQNIFPEEVTVPPQFRLNQPLDQRTYLLDGQLRTWEGPQQEVLSPIFVKSGAQFARPRVGSHPLFDSCQALQALDSAVRAYDHGLGLWPTMPVAERIHRVEEFVRLMKQKRSEVVLLLMWEICKTLADAEKEFDRTIDYVVDTIEALKEIDRSSSRFTIEQQIIGQIRRAPLGVVLCMGPYNYPLNETFTTLIPALIMGNTVVLKPARFGVLLLQPLLEAFKEAFPPGVVNTIYGEGPEVIAPIMRSGKVDCLAFIGSSRVADVLKQQHPQPHRLRSVLGLGAKNPAIVLGDAELSLTVSECVAGALSFNGQRCTALKIIFVQESILDSFLEKFVQEVERLKFGMPWEAGVKITPLPEPEMPARFAQYMQDCCNKGASVLNVCGGTINGSYFHPAVLFPVSSGSALYSEEQFGPLVPIVAFRDVSEPIEYVVNSPYGQQASLFGQDPNVLARLIDPLVNQVCRLNINSQCQRGPDQFPFTGRKNSAEGTLSVTDALRVFSIRSLVAAKNIELNRRILDKIVRERKSSFLSTDFIF